VADAPTASFDRAALIEHITGAAGGATALERRVVRGVGAPPEGEELLRVEGLTRPGVVEDVSFSVRAGELLGIAGLVGSGRTELVRAVAGADRATAGRVLVGGQQVDVRSTRRALRGGIVLVPEDRRSQGLVLDFGVRQNATLATLPRHRLAPPLPVPSARRERESTQALRSRLAIAMRGPEQPVRDLSGGNQQKVVLAKWLLRGGEVFLFDEPTHGVDVEAKEELYDLLEELAAEGKAVVFVSSEFSELVGVCHRVLVLSDGRLVGELVGDEITESAILERCYAA
jgi:ABC-type sugar transport system ATPase subunit